VTSISRTDSGVGATSYPVATKRIKHKSRPEQEVSSIRDVPAPVPAAGLPVPAVLDDDAAPHALAADPEIDTEIETDTDPDADPDQDPDEDLPGAIVIDDPEGDHEGAREATRDAAPKDADETAPAVVPYDPLNRYLTEIRRFPLLTRAEELDIARHYREHADPADAYRLVTSNLRLVVKIAYEFARASRNLLDLIQEGNVGLMEAVKNFDPGRGIRFPSYAVWWVRAYIYRYLINNWRLVKIGTTQAQRKLFFNLRKEMEKLEAEGFRPQPKLLAQRMGVKESEVVEMQERLANSEVSLDRPIGGVNGDDDTSLIDILADSGDTPEQTVAEEQFRNFAHEQVNQFAATLKDKELEIFRHRLLAEDPMTLQEMGDKFGISRERVRQIESRLKRQLKAFLTSQGHDIEQAGS